MRDEMSCSIPTRAQVLFLTDDPDASRVWKHVLNRHDIDVIVTEYDRTLDVHFSMDSFHTLIVDHYGEPDLALQFCQELRPMSPQPLLLCTYETDESFQLEAYRLGVEECIKKPIGIPLFAAKVRSWLRKVILYGDFAQELASDRFHLDLESRVLGTPDASVTLSMLECRLMQVFLSNRGQILEKHFVTRRVWSMYSDPDSRMLKNLVYRLRRKIEGISNGSPHIERVEAIGYVFHDFA